MITNFFDEYKGMYVMHCQTEDEANSFLAFLHNAGRQWSNGESYMKRNNYNTYGDNIVYYFNIGKYGTKSGAISSGYIILEWSDFIEDENEEDEISDEEFCNMLSDLLYE